MTGVDADLAILLMAARYYDGAANDSGARAAHGRVEAELSRLREQRDARYELDEYEVTNLRAGLQTLRSLQLDTGDWLGQILFKLPATVVLPNRAVSVQVSQVQERAEAAEAALAEAEAWEKRSRER